MKSLLEAYRKIDENRSRFKPLLYWCLAILLGIIFLLYFVPISNKILSFLQIFLSIITSVIAASLIEIFSGIRDVWVREGIRKKFVEFFSCGFNSGSTLMILSRFPTERLSEKIQKIDLDPTGNAIKRIKEGRGTFLSSDDVMAATEILIAFDQVQLPLPVFDWDDYLVEKLKSGNDPSNVKTLISIGLYSNQLTKYVNDNDKVVKMFRIVVEGNKWNDPDAERKILLARYKGHSLALDEWEEYKNTPDDEFVLVSKVVLPSRQTVFIIGGITATGTNVIGKYLKEYWLKELYLARDENSENRLLVEGNQFAAVFKINQNGSMITKQRVVVPDYLYL